MIFPADTIIARPKLTHYLLRPREDHDKSGFLVLAGYDQTEADRLERDIREQLLPLEATFIETSPYGEKYLIRGPLTGPNGKTLKVVSVWMREIPSGVAKFVTLYPDRR